MRNLKRALAAVFVLLLAAVVLFFVLDDFIITVIVPRPVIVMMDHHNFIAWPVESRKVEVRRHLHAGAPIERRMTAIASWVWPVHRRV